MSAGNVMSRVELGGVGVWSPGLRYGDQEKIPSAAGELEELGYSALWIPDMGGPTFEALDVLLAATKTVTIATGILSIWNYTPQDVATWWGSLGAVSRDRLLIGIGVSHGLVIGERWKKPLSTMVDYLDGLEAEGFPLNRVCLAALGPKMLELASTRTAGVHPYFVTPEHTAVARAAVGDALLAVEQGVVLDSDIARARDAARTNVKGYASLPNYANNLKRLGFTDDELAGGSDGLVDAMIACGDEPVIAERIAEHVKAGADHVCLQVIADTKALPQEDWRRLAGVIA